MSELSNDLWADTQVSPIQGISDFKGTATRALALRGIYKQILWTHIPTETRLLVRDLLAETFEERATAVSLVVNSGLPVPPGATLPPELLVEIQEDTVNRLQTRIVLMSPDLMGTAAKLCDLQAYARLPRPWMHGLPRLIRVSEIDTSFSSSGQFDFLEAEMRSSILTDEGKRHMWLWPTDHPAGMAEFADRMGGLPENVCAMTRTGVSSLGRVDELRMVKAATRGLLIDAMWEHIPHEKLDLAGIDWVIVGGMPHTQTQPFPLEWVRELRDHCQRAGAAFFLTRLGGNPFANGKPIKLKDKHGGNWEEWDADLRVREFPAYFYSHRHDLGKIKRQRRKAGA